MITMANMKIQTKVLLLAIAPALVLALILSATFINQQFSELDNSLRDNASNYSQHIATNSEYGLLSGNLDDLDRLINAVFSIPNNNILAIYILDNKNTVLASSDKLTEFDLSIDKFTRYTDKVHDIDDEMLLAQSHIVASEVAIDDPAYELNNSILRNDSNNKLGRAILIASKDIINQKKSFILKSSLTITFILIAISALIAYRFSKGITNPISNLAITAKEIEKGNLDARSQTNATNEIGILTHGLNNMADALQESQRTLQEKIDGATKDLHATLKQLEEKNTQLEIATQSAEAANDAKSIFLANMSHELRTPINGIIGFANLLRKDNLTNEQNDYINFVYSAANSLLNIINDILDISKVESGKIVLNNEHFCLRDCIEDVVFMLYPSAREKGNNLIYKLDPGIPEYLYGDEQKLKQIMLNLLGNAIKYTDCGQIYFNTELVNKEEDFVNIQVSIKDSGIGINESDIDNIFQPFSQSEITKNSGFQGTGLGLSIANSFVKLMGGEFGVQSTPNKGSTFWFRIQYKISNKETLHNRDLSRFNDLIAVLYDTDQSTSEYLQSQISTLNIHTIYTQTEERLLNIIGTHSTDSRIFIIFTIRNYMDDIKIISNVINKYGALRERFVVLLDHYSPALTKKLYPYGIDKILFKPYKQSDLTDIINSIFMPSADIIELSRYASKKNLKQLYPEPNILVAEDNTINSKLIEILLKSFGANVVIANNGKEAVELFTNNEFDIVFMDIYMPILNGKDATKIIRKWESTDTITPIYALTAYIAESERDNLLKLGFTDILLKPIDEIKIEELTKTCQKKNNQGKSGCNIFNGINAEFTIPLANNNPSIALEMYEKFIADLRKKRDMLDKAVTENHRRNFSEIIHKLHGGCSMCGTSTLNNILNDIETRLSDKSTSINGLDLSPLYSEIDELLEGEEEYINYLKSMQYRD
jgi:two-component system sensor histidine kinase BarA